MSTLFVVDDEEIDQSILKLTLLKCPLFEQVLYFHSGMSLIKYLKDHSNDSAHLPDVIFLDINMPRFSGWDVLDALQVIYPTLSKRIKVYIVSVSVWSGDIFKAKEYDFVQKFISKPITKE
jgi:CheY-like chemotaxis protein